MKVCRRLNFALHKLYLSQLGDFVDCDYCKSKWIPKFPIFAFISLNTCGVFSKFWVNFVKEGLFNSIKVKQFLKANLSTRMHKSFKTLGHYVSKTLIQCSKIFLEAPSTNNL